MITVPEDVVPIFFILANVKDEPRPSLARLVQQSVDRSVASCRRIVT
jgi:hypothetical protein